MFRRYLTNSLAIASLLLFAANSFGQGTTGQIAGTVTDPNGAVVPGATVKATNSATNLGRETTTDSDGVYGFQLLPPGRYRIEITAQGFAGTTAEADVNITQTTPVDIQLTVAGGTATVDVEAPVLQTETSQQGRTITGETVRQLPLPTRNFQQLLTLSAGAQNSLSNSTDLGRGDVTVSVNGQRTTSNTIRINGVDANSIGTNSTPNLAVPASDTLQEFIVQTSLYDASSGRNSGGNIEAVTRSGSNDFHGGAYYFFRDEGMAANEPFIKARGLERPELSRHQFGGLLGGPIIKDRLFFFGSYQHSTEKNGYSLLNSLTSPNVPAGLRDDNRTAAGLASTFGIAPATISQVAVNILNARLPDGSFAIPSSGITSTTTPFQAVVIPQSGVSEFEENQFNANIDWVITDRHNLSAKFFVADNPTTQANYNFAGLGNGERQLIGFGGDLTIKQKLYSITDNYVFSSNIVNQARFDFNRLRVTSVPVEPFTASQLGISSPLSSLFPGAPTMRVFGADSQFFFGSAPLSDQSSRINGYNFSDTLSVTHGSHRLRMGGDFRYSTIKFYFNAFSRGQINFPSFTSFLQGGSVFTTVSLLGSGVFDRSYRVKDWSGFIQDDWKVNSRLTLNLGLRYDAFGLPAEEQGRLVNFLPNQAVIGTPAAPAQPPNGFVQAEGGPLAGVPMVEKTLVPTDHNNFSPRIGFAWVLDEQLKMVVRGGYGFYYDRFSTRFANTQLFNFPYFALGVGLPGAGQTFANPFINMPAPSAFPVAATIPSPLTPLANPLVGVPIAGVFVDPDLQTPYVEQYNLGLQWELGRNFVLDVGYVGNRGRHLLQVVTLNQPIYNPVTNAFTTRYPATIISANKNATGGVQQVQTSSLSTYNSFQASLSKRFSSGLQFLAAYTFGKSIDYYSGTALNELQNIAGDQVKWWTNRGRSDFNREQRFVFSGVYDLPWKFESGVAKALLNDWQIAGIAVFQSGLPFSIVADNGTSIISRANVNTNFVGDIYTSGSMSERTIAYFNAAAFTRPCVNAACSTAVGAVTNPTFDPNAPFGNTTRNFLTGPGQKNVDISFIKFIPFGEKFRGELRAEFFNVFNWVNYANPNNNIIGANFGRIERASSGPRVIQLGFKLTF